LRPVAFEAQQYSIQSQVSPLRVLSGNLQFTFNAQPGQYFFFKVDNSTASGPTDDSLCMSVHAGSDRVITTYLTYGKIPTAADVAQPYKTANSDNCIQIALHSTKGAVFASMFATGPAPFTFLVYLDPKPTTVPPTSGPPPEKPADENQAGRAAVFSIVTILIVGLVIAISVWGYRRLKRSREDGGQTYTILRDVHTATPTAVSITTHYTEMPSTRRTSR